MLTSETYQRHLAAPGSARKPGSVIRALIEFAGYRDSFRNTTVMGAINGIELHLGAIDDPMKRRAERLP